LIDLHTHTSESDGRCSPVELVARAAAAGVDILSVTDHDTTAGCGPASRACADAGVEFVCGIEVTSIVDDVDVHVLGYFITADHMALSSFLAEQRRRRIDRVRQMIDRLAVHGIALDAGAILGPGLSDRGKAIGRPSIARALVAAGHVRTTSEAFDVWLAKGRPAFVPRAGPPPEDVIARIHAAGGIASLAHPALNGRDHLIGALVDSGLDAIEAYHTDHTPADTSRYLAFAQQFGVAISGGSDYHADETHGGEPGCVSLPRDAYERLKARRRPA
jgi:predicted metal-dependent phosphoesterase TrpH